MSTKTVSTEATIFFSLTCVKDIVGPSTLDGLLGVLILLHNVSMLEGCWYKHLNLEVQQLESCQGNVRYVIHHNCFPTSSA